MADASLIKQTANALVAGLKKGDLTPHDLLDALEARIGEVDGKVNALPTFASTAPVPTLTTSWRSRWTSAAGWPACRCRSRTWLMWLVCAPHKAR
jgi:Asp-tRNA(Asn)/Glu-tRNA(Gln) amidotransferase A subunit family amidase